MTTVCDLRLLLSLLWSGPRFRFSGAARLWRHIKTPGRDNRPEGSGTERLIIVVEIAAVTLALT